MQAGRLRHRVVIQNNTPSQNTSGEPIESWGTYATRWAAVEPLAGQERLAAQQFESQVDTRIRLRWELDHGIDPNMRAQWTDGGVTRTYEIDTVIDVMSNRREIHLMCTERQDAL